ncbi:hypothetical protein CAEBREN_23990 [Caenorhabditis brenneri]|uniref:Uncharacterized protein n=1 Tax=Caenorhabditis brenneri TaxID=135651 RepID=G0P455_CAEBE|nr:hypothetical protein CAEBREN_23990 [Caenorhabditis brenneri]
MFGFVPDAPAPTPQPEHLFNQQFLSAKWNHEGNNRKIKDAEVQKEAELRTLQEEIRNKDMHLKKNLKQKLEDSARLQKEQNEQNKEKEAKLLEKQADLQKQVDSLVMQQKLFQTLISGTAKMLNKGGDNPSTSSAVNKIMDQGKTAIMEQIKKDTEYSGKKRAAEIEASSTAKKKAKNVDDEDSD